MCPNLPDARIYPTLPYQKPTRTCRNRTCFGLFIPFYDVLEVVHGPGGVTMHLLRTLREWYNIVHWTPLIKNQDVNTRYIGSYPLFWMVFKMVAVKKCQYSVISVSYPQLCLLFMSRTSSFKTLNFISDIKSLMYGLSIVHLRWSPL